MKKYFKLCFECCHRRKVVMLTGFLNYSQDGKVFGKCDGCGYITAELAITYIEEDEREY